MAKNKWTGSLLLLVLLGCSSSSGGGGGVLIVPPRWATLFRTPTTVNLRSVRFVAPGVGIVAGDSTAIFRTNNGGATWTQQEHEPFDRGGDIVEIDGVGGVLHAVGNDASGAKYWETNDSVNWTTPDVPGTAGTEFTATAVPTTVDAFYLQRDGVILNNFGGTLTPVTPQLPAGNWLALKWFEAGGVASSFAYAAGDIGGAAVVYYRDNTGAWNAANLSVAGMPTVAAFSFSSDTAGLACGGDKVIKTLNRTDWADVSTAPLAGSNLRGIHFPLTPGSLNLTDAWAVGDNAAIFYTDDGGATWQDQNPNIVGLTVPNVNLYDVWFVSDLMTGYAVGDSGVVLKTTDAGTTWTDVSNGGVVSAGGTYPDFNDVGFTRDGSIGLAVGDVWNGAANVWRTLDFGATWTLFNAGLPVVDLHGVSIPEVGGSGDLAYACGTTGVIQITRDLRGAGGWSGPTNSAPPIVTYRDILFASGDNFGVVVGDSGTVLDLANNSLAIPPTFTWSAPTAAPPAGPNYLALSRTYTPLAAGGLRYYTGATANTVALMEPVGVPTPITAWVTLVPAPPGGTVIQALDSPANFLEIAGANLFAGATDGNVYVFIGGTWATTTPTPAAAITGMAFPYGDPGNPALHSGLATNANGIFFTNDAGTAWAVSPDHTSEPIRGIWMSSLSPGLGYAVGTNGTILRTTVGGQ